MNIVAGSTGPGGAAEEQRETVGSCVWRVVEMVSGRFDDGQESAL